MSALFVECLWNKKSSFPFFYLGIPLLKGILSSAHLLPIADKIHPQLDSWQGKTLSFVGRICLLESVITSMFIHSFMIYKWPSSLISSLNKSTRNFFLVWFDFEEKAY